MRPNQEQTELWDSICTPQRVEELLQQGVNPNFTMPEDHRYSGWSPLMLAITVSRPNNQVAKLLLDAGAHVNQIFPTTMGTLSGLGFLFYNGMLPTSKFIGKPLIFYAVDSLDSNLVDLLLAKGCNPNSTYNNWPLLAHSIRFFSRIDYPDSVLALLKIIESISKQQGVDFNQQVLEPGSVFHNWSSIAIIFRILKRKKHMRYAVLDTLLKNGLSPTQIILGGDYSGITITEAVARTGDVELQKLLTEHARRRQPAPLENSSTLNEKNDDKNQSEKPFSDEKEKPLTTATKSKQPLDPELAKHTEYTSLSQSLSLTPTSFTDTPLKEKAPIAETKSTKKIGDKKEVAELFPPITETVLDRIIASEEYAAMKSFSNETWLHHLVAMPFHPHLKAKVQQAARKVVSKVSRYERTIKDGFSYTAVYQLTQQDPYELTQSLKLNKWELNFVGVKTQIDQIKEFLNSSLSSNFLILQGPAGTGKTDLVRSILPEHKFEIHEYHPHEQNDGISDNRESRLRDFFQSKINYANRFNRKVCIFVEKIDSIASEHEGKPRTGLINQNDLVNTLAIEIDGLKGTQVVLIGTTNRFSELANSIRQKAQQVIKFSLPNLSECKQLIARQLRNCLIEKDATLEALAEATSGWSAKFLKIYLDKILLRAGKNQSRVLQKDLEDEFAPMREAMKAEFKAIPDLELPSLKPESTNPFNNLVGLTDEIKDQLELMTSYLQNPETYSGAAPNPLLLYGPGGNGKTAFARALAQCTNAAFIPIDGGQYQNTEGPEKIKDIFNIARRFPKAVLFVDEADAIAGQGAHAAKTVQLQIQGFKEHSKPLVIIFATNYRDRFSHEMLTRFKRVKVLNPNYEQRFKLFIFLIQKINIPRDEKLSGSNLDSAAKQFATCSSDLSNREIEMLVKEANQNARRRSVKSGELLLTFDDVMNAIKQKQSSVNEEREAEIASLNRGPAMFHKQQTRALHEDIPDADLSSLTSLLKTQNSSQ